MLDYFKNKKADVSLLIILTSLALLFFLVNLNQAPLVDYDEATYAKVVSDTLKSGQLASLKLYDAPWFIKPPLYFWLAMLSVKVFGVSEIIFRLPSVLMAILSLWLIFLITKKITGNNIIAISAFLILLFSPIFYAFSREIRMESGLTMSMLLALYFLILGWKNNKYLLLFFPAMAIGFLIKNVATFLIIPIAFIYSLFYNHWRWLKSKFLWLGLVISFFILIPWHLIQYRRFSNLFLKEFFFSNINQVLFSTKVTHATGLSTYFGYLNLFWQYYQPWTVLILLLIVLLIICLLFNRNIKSFRVRVILAPLCGGLFILLFFAFTKTHFSTYTFPAIPFLAMFIAISFYKIFNYFKLEKLTIVLLIPLLFVGYLFNLKAIKSLVQPYHYEEKEVGLIFKNKNKQDYPLYIISWPFLETIRYYADTQEINLDIFANGGETLKAPAYILINASALPYFYDSQGNFLTDYEGIQAVYKGTFLFLVYSERDITLPVLRQ